MNKYEARQLATELNLPAGPLSNSQINEYMKCPRSYYYKYIERIKTGFNKNLFYGILMHCGLEQLNHQVVNNNIDIQKVFKLVKTKSVEELTRINNLSYLKNKTHINTMKGLELLLKQWRMKGINSVKPTGIEVILHKQIGNYPFILKIDLIDDNKRVIDYKLTGRYKTNTDVNNSLQLSLYSYATKIPKVSYISFKFPTLSNKWKPEFKEVTCYKTESQIKWSIEVINSIGNQIVNREFPCTSPDNWICREGSCDFYNICRGKVENVQKLEFLKNIISIKE